VGCIQGRDKNRECRLTTIVSSISDLSSKTAFSEHEDCDGSFFKTWRGVIPSELHPGHPSNHTTKGNIYHDDRGCRYDHGFLEGRNQGYAPLFQQRGTRKQGRGEDSRMDTNVT
jgi:hypothetical protein